MAHMSILWYFVFTIFLGTNTLFLGINSMFGASENSLFGGFANFLQTLAAIRQFAATASPKGRRNANFPVIFPAVREFQAKIGTA